MRYPQFLKKNDTIGITAMSAAINDKLGEYENSINYLKSQGFDIKQSTNVFTSGLVSGSAKERIRQLNALLNDPVVKAIIIARGGDLLFEIVPDALDGLRGSDGSVTMPVDGVVLSVLAQSGEEIAKDQPMATYCEKQDMQLVCPADEEDLAAIQVGMEVPVTLDAYCDETMTGTVVSIAGASAEGGSSASFDVTIRLPENEHVRIGMNATATLK